MISIGILKRAPKDGAKEGGDESAEEAGPSLSEMAGKKAAGKVLAALEAGDAGALHAALKAHYEACSE